jgi:inhibitor of cysteine peptidase
MVMKKILKIVAMLFVVSIVIFAAGCAEKKEAPGNETPETPAAEEENMTGNNTSETIAEDNYTVVNETTETGQVVTEADNGTSISLNKGENFTLNLTENPSTGYAWELNVSEGLSILSDNYTQGPTSENMTGVPGTHSWVIEAVASGSQQVNGIYKRAWENTTGTEENFTITVDVV